MYIFFSDLLLFSTKKESLIVNILQTFFLYIEYQYIYYYSISFIIFIISLRSSTADT